MSKFLLGVLLWCSLIFSGAVSADPIGSPAADFSAQTLGGQAFQLSALKGQPILLKIGTTWCPSCRTQAKTIDKVRPFLVENGVRLVDVFIDETARSVERYYRAGGYKKADAIILDNGSAYEQYNVYVIPRVLLIDEDFNIVRDGGDLSARQLKSLVTDMVEGR